jgi:hypothetical protein
VEPRLPRWIQAIENWICPDLCHRLLLHVCSLVGLSPRLLYSESRSLQFPKNIQVH